MADVDRSLERVRRARRDLARENDPRKGYITRSTAKAKKEEVLRMHKDGIPPLEIAKTLGLGKSSVYRLIR